MKTVLREALIVAVAAALIAFAANAISPKGLNLTHNYFRGSAPPPPVPHKSEAGSPATNAASEQDLIAAHFKEKGLQLVNTEQTLKLFHDIKYQEGSIIFIDVHNDEHYLEKHIPGAYQFDNFYPEKYIGPVLAACQTAQKIVVYCNGGQCPDSESTALMLRDDAHIPADRLFIYSGGITEWSDKRLPLETGPRNSGKLLNVPAVTK